MSGLAHISVLRRLDSVECKEVEMDSYGQTLTSPNREAPLSLPAQLKRLGEGGQGM